MMRTLPLACLFALSTTIITRGQSADIDVAALTRGSNQVVIGTVVDATGRMGTNAYGDRLIFTDLRVDVSETLKGDSRNVVVVTVEGGQAAGLTLKVSDMPTLKRGDRAVYFLVKGTPEWIPYARGRGVVRIDTTDHLDNTSLTLTDARTRILGAR
jgi:hypothetical protein